MEVIECKCATSDKRGFHFRDSLWHYVKGLQNVPGCQQLIDRPHPEHGKHQTPTLLTDSTSNTNSFLQDTGETILAFEQTGASVPDSAHFSAHTVVAYVRFQPHQLHSLKKCQFQVPKAETTFDLQD